MAAYLIAHIDVTDPEAYKLYAAETPGVAQQYGGRFVVRGGNPAALEGALPAPRLVVLEFADRAAVQRFYESPEYQKIIPLRQAASKGCLYIADGA